MEKNKIKNLPLYEIIVDLEDEDSGMIRNAFVKQPAVMYNKFAFSEETPLHFDANDDAQMFMGVSILADTPIHRKANGMEFNVVFKPNTVRTILNKLVMNGRQNEVALQHGGEIIEGVYMVESFISEKGRAESAMFDVPDGSLITTYFVPDREQYLALKNDPEFNGFSIELDPQGTGLSQVFEVPEDIIEEEIVKVLESDLSDDEKESKIRELIK